MKKVAIIIINFNSSNFTINCVNSILKHTDERFDYEIIVIDNNSKIDDFNILKPFLDSNNIKYFRTKINIGFSGGNMMGVHLANAEYYYFLNNDCEFLNDNLSVLYTFMDNNKDVGISAGQMHNADLSEHHSFNYFPTLSLKLFGSSILRIFNPKAFPSKKKKYLEPIRVPYVTGAGMFVSAEKISEIGGLDTNLFLYHEEEDIALNLLKKGFKCYLVPNAKFIHFAGKSTTRNYAVMQEDYISLLYYFRKHYSFFTYNILKINYFLKIFKKSYKGLDYLKISMFILKNAPMKDSLRFKQKIQQ